MRKLVPALLLLTGVCFATQSALAQTAVNSTTYYEDDACVADLVGSVYDCTAEDVRVGVINVQEVIDACLFVGDTATLAINYEVVVGATERYDIGFFLRRDDGAAAGFAGTTGTDDGCYITVIDTDGTTGQPDGNNLEGNKADNCGDLGSVSSPYTTTTEVITVDCADRNSDGFADLSVCAVWDNNTAGVCDPTVDDDASGLNDYPFPSTNSKCKCEDLGTTPAIPSSLCTGTDNPVTWPSGDITKLGGGDGEIDIATPAGASSIELTIANNINIVDILDQDGVSLTGTGEWSCTATLCTDLTPDDDGQPTAVTIQVNAPVNASSRFQFEVDDECPRTFSFDPEVSFHDDALPLALVLDQNYPNPFNPQTRIGYYVPETSELSLAIYDVTGRKVRTLAAGQYEAGRYEVTWNGINDYGVQVPSGVYIYRLEIDGQVQQSRRLTLMR